jgi:hypothetical protein
VKQLVEEEELLKVVQVKSRRLKDFRDRDLIPFIKTGRSILYDPEKVIAALERFERKAADKPQKRRSGKKAELN